MLPIKVDNHLFNLLLENSSLADRAHLISVSSPHAASWISVIPSEGFGLHLQPSEFQVAIKWWLGLDTSSGAMCRECSQSPWPSRSVVSHQDTLAEACRWAHLSVKEATSPLTSPLTVATPAQLTFGYPTGLWASQRNLNYMYL